MEELKRIFKETTRWYSFYYKDIKKESDELDDELFITHLEHANLKSYLFEEKLKLIDDYYKFFNTFINTVFNIIPMELRCKINNTKIYSCGCILFCHDDEVLFEICNEDIIPHGRLTFIL